MPVCPAPRAQGAVDLSVQAGEQGTVLKTLRQSGSLKVLFPNHAGSEAQAVLINTAGGITGGDHFQTKALAHAGAELTITTQTSERAYRAQPGQTGILTSHVTVEDGAKLNWLPQETILFQGCALSRSLRIDAAKDASVLMVEPLVFGRLAMGEVLTNAAFRDRIEIHRGGKLAYLDAVHLNGNIAAQLARPHVSAKAGAMVNLVYIAPDASARLDPIRELLTDTGGASLIDDDLLVLRLLAADSYLLRQTLIPILNLLTGDTLPRCWMT